MTTSGPTVTVAIPTLNEERHIEPCLEAVAAQTYPGIIEILVVDGGSTDRTRALVGRHPGVRLLENHQRIQAAALNIAIREAKGEIFVRVDGHCLIAPDYVERCVDALHRTGAAMVGGSQQPVGGGAPRQRGITAALRSRVGGGPASFRHDGVVGWCDTVYLGAMWTETALRVGGYAEEKVTNEDAELAVRLKDQGGVWLDPAVRSTYEPRATLPALARQYYRYGVGRAGTAAAHPGSIRLRQLAAPLLLAGLLTPWRRSVGLAYAAAVLTASASLVRRDPQAWPTFLAAVPVMHGAWGAGFWAAMAVGLRRRLMGRAATSTGRAAS